MHDLAPGATTVFTDAAGAGAGVAADIGGTGKTRQTAALTGSLWESGAVDLVVWVVATSRDAIVMGYAQALADVGAGGVHDDAVLTAQRFLAWLADTERRWLVVLDGLADPSDMDGLWPPAVPAGRVLATSRLGTAALHGPDRQVIEIGAFDQREAMAFLSARLQGRPEWRAGAIDLVTALGGLPLALSLACDLMVNLQIGCRDCLHSLAERGGEPGSDPRTVLSAMCRLAVGHADRFPPAGLAWPTLVFAAQFDPAGVPGTVFDTQEAGGYIFFGGPPAGNGTGMAVVRDALATLARLGLLIVDPADAARTVRVRPVVRDMVRASLSPADFRQAGSAAAGALLRVWPDRAPLLTGQAFRDCAAGLGRLHGGLIDFPGGRALLSRVGESLGEVHLRESAVAHWRGAADAAGRTFAPDHAHALFAYDGLATAQAAAGHMNEAIELRLHVVAGHEGTLGADHPDTLAARTGLASAYQLAGRPDKALPLFERTHADHERVLGADHPDTLTACGNLAHAYRLAGRAKEATALFERTLAGRERVLGADHPDTLTACGNLAYSYRLGGRMKHALPLYERTLAGRERVLGPDHPDTITSRGNLASAYMAAGRMKHALPLYERTLAGRERALGPDHPDTITSRGNLASAYMAARRLKDAIPLYERTLAGCERVLGPDHPDTITSRGNLASAYHTAMRLVDAMSMFQRALGDCERVLGADHQLTRTIRDNLDAVRRE